MLKFFAIDREDRRQHFQLWKAFHEFHENLFLKLKHNIPIILYFLTSQTSIHLICSQLVKSIDLSPYFRSLLEYRSRCKSCFLNSNLSFLSFHHLNFDSHLNDYYHFIRLSRHHIHHLSYYFYDNLSFLFMINKFILMFH